MSTTPTQYNLKPFIFVCLTFSLRNIFIRFAQFSILTYKPNNLVDETRIQ